MRRDAVCDESCENDSKPLENSEWILTTLNSERQLVPNANKDMRLPNIGCMWRCADGYSEQKLDMAGFSLCILGAGQI
jgi:hypothetical protein